MKHLKLIHASVKKKKNQFLKMLCKSKKEKIMCSVFQNDTAWLTIAVTVKVFLLNDELSNGVICHGKAGRVSLNATVKKLKCFSANSTNDEFQAHLLQERP